MARRWKELQRWTERRRFRRAQALLDLKAWTAQCAHNKGGAIMKRIGLWIVILGLLFAAIPASAGDPKLATSSGQVVSVDTKANAVVVKVETNPGEASEIPFTIAKETKVIKGGDDVGIAGIMTGDRVTVTFQTVNGKNVAVNVGIESKPSA
jgi:Cu/Ag efflux protein CusF